MTAGRKRKRYLLFMSSGQIDHETQKELTRLISERFSGVEKKLVWLDWGLIVRTDLEHLPAMKALDLRAGDARLETRSVSGSISKLKRMAAASGR